MTEITFLGTGNFLANGRYWNSFVVDRRLLIEPSPTALPHLRRAGFTVADLDAIFISHFHPDHTFGWPFLLLELLRGRGDRPLGVVGPPGVEAFLAEMTQLSGVGDVHQAAHARVHFEYVEVDCGWQAVNGQRFRAVEVDHVPHLRCYGYLLDIDGRTIAYSGDTNLCAGLEELAANADALVLECNGRHPWPAHMDMESVRVLRERHPSPRYVLTHVGDDVDIAELPGFTLPDDFDTIDV